MDDHIDHGGVDREVRVRLSVYDITSIDEKEGAFSCSFFVEVSWEDPDLKRQADDCGRGEVEGGAELGAWEQMFPYVRCAHGTSKRWSPRLNFENIIGAPSDDVEKWHRVFFYSRDGNTLLPAPVVCFRMSGSGTFRESYELHRFPFDAQDLSITITSMIDAPSEQKQKRRSLRRRSKRPSLQHSDSHNADMVMQVSVRLVRNTNASYQSVLPVADSLPEWTLGSHMRAYEGVTSPTRSSSGVSYPTLSMAIKATRKPQYFVWNVVFPQFLFVLLCFPCLLLPQEALVDRFSIILALLLASVTYQASMAEHLPKMSYLTWIDTYNVLCVTTMAALGIESTIVYQLAKRSGNPASFELALEDDAGSAVVVAWCALHLLPLIVAQAAVACGCCAARQSPLEDKEQLLLAAAAKEKKKK